MDMPKGRPRKPVELEKLQGCPGRRPLKEVKKTEAVTSKYPAPDYLSPEGKKEWKKIITAYEKIGMIRVGNSHRMIFLSSRAKAFLKAYKNRAVE